MPTDTLALGPFVFTDFAVPDKLMAGGKQQLVVHRMPGGDRVIDAMGPDDSDRIFGGTFWGDDALAQALTLDAWRRSGTVLPYSNGVEARSVIIHEFTFEVHKFTQVAYAIILTPTDSFGGGGGFGGGVGFGGFGLSIGVGLGSVEAVVSADLGVVGDLLGASSIGVSASLGAEGFGLSVG